MRVLTFFLCIGLTALGNVHAEEGIAETEILGGSSDLKAFFPEPNIIDSTMEAEKYREFDRDTLYDYINGGAEVYLDLDFVKVGARDYLIELEEETYFTLDVYDMEKPVNAFGIFSAERYGDIPEVDVGVQGYMGGGALNFWCQRFYVKIRADDDSESVERILKKMAGLVAGKMGDPGRMPAQLELFPSKHRVKGKEKYAARNLLGLGRLKGFYCPFKKKKEEITLYLSRYESEREAQQVEKLFVKRLKTPPQPAEDHEGLRFDDKYMGRGRILRVGRYLAIAQGLAGDAKKNVWRNETIGAFYEKVTEAALKEKTEKALESLMGGGAEDDG